MKHEAFPLTRKTPLARSSKPLTRKKALNKVSPNRARKRKSAKMLYCDSFGVPFAEANRVALQIRFTMKDIKRPEVLKFVHEHSGDHQFEWTEVSHWTFGKCWICSQYETLEAHHVVSRWDFVGNICMCCHSCHECVQHNTDALPEVLRALWKNNRLALSWIHLIRARGSYFPFDSLD